MKPVTQIVTIILFVITTIPQVHAQSPTRLSIQGTLIDEGGTPYAFNPITLTASGQTLEGQTDYQGHFTLSGQIIGTSGTLTLKSTYGDETLAEVPVVWGSGGEAATINLGETTVSLKERRFVGATEFALPGADDQPESADAQSGQADLMSEPSEAAPAAVDGSGSGAIGVEPAPAEDTSSGSPDAVPQAENANSPASVGSGGEVSSETPPAVANPAEVPAQPLGAARPESGDAPTPTQVNRTGALIAMAILAVLGLGLIGGGMVAAKRSGAAKVRVKAKSKVDF